MDKRQSRLIHMLVYFIALLAISGGMAGCVQDDDEDEGSGDDGGDGGDQGDGGIYSSVVHPVAPRPGG